MTGCNPVPRDVYPAWGACLVEAVATRDDARIAVQCSVLRCGCDAWNALTFVACQVAEHVVAAAVRKHPNSRPVSARPIGLTDDGAPISIAVQLTTASINNDAEMLDALARTVSDPVVCSSSGAVYDGAFGHFADVLSELLNMLRDVLTGDRHRVVVDWLPNRT